MKYRLFTALCFHVFSIAKRGKSIARELDASAIREAREGVSLAFVFAEKIERPEQSS